MKKTDVIEFFGTQSLVAEALGITQPSVAEWKETIPLLRQFQLERLTNGKLKIEKIVNKKIKTVSKRNSAS